MLGPKVPAGFTAQGFSSSAKGFCGVYSLGLSSSASACWVYSFGFVFGQRFVLGLLLRVFLLGQRFVLVLLLCVVVFGQRFLRGLFLGVFYHLAALQKFRVRVRGAPKQKSRSSPAVISGPLHSLYTQGMRKSIPWHGMPKTPKACILNRRTYTAARSHKASGSKVCVVFFIFCLSRP